MLALASGFVAQGHDVDVVVATADGPFRSAVPRAARIVDIESRVARVPGIRERRGLRVLATVAGLSRYLQRENPNVLLATSNPANLVALAARRVSAMPIPVVVSVNVNVTAATTSRGRLWPPVLRAALKMAYPRADRVIAISNGVAGDLVSRFGVQPERLTVIANPIDVATIRRGATSPLDHAWVQPASPPLVLGVGKLGLQKDFPTLLRAFARVRREREANLVILGDGADRPHLEALVGELALERCVWMPGFVTNPYAWMARASVFVLSSAWEGFSNALAEALACGCPVVSTDCPSGPAEMLDGGRLGPLVEPGNAEAMADAILAVMAAPPQRALLAGRAEAFGVEAATGRYLSVLRDAVVDGIPVDAGDGGAPARAGAGG